MTDREARFQKYADDNGLTLHTESGCELVPGDWYLAERNTGIKLLECREVNHGDGWVCPVGFEYAYDWYECRKVTLRTLT